MLGDFDDWYVQGKSTQAKFNSSTPLHSSSISSVGSSGSGSSGHLFLARDVISFHYVSETEARLLYELLDSADTSSGSNGILSSSDAAGGGVVAGSMVEKLFDEPKLSPVCRTIEHRTKGDSQHPHCSSDREIHALWPSNDAKAGHYSRPLSRGPHSIHEAELLYDFISSVMIQSKNCS